MTSIQTETETVVKKILPYLIRRGYDPITDLNFETSVTSKERYSKGYVDILVTLGDKKPYFLIEAKRISKKLTKQDSDQAISYGLAKEAKVPFVVVTNGSDIQCFNTNNKKAILWDGKLTEKIPTKEQLKIVIRALKSKPESTKVSLSNDISLPFKPGLPLRQLNALFYKCHSTIRKIEKNEESAFADFSKLLFLKLLEEKCDVESEFNLPYSYRFHELAAKPDNEADQVRDSVLTMIATIVKRTPYGEVLEEEIKLKNPKTFHKLIRALSSVSFWDCSLDSKGAAFEYFVRATLKGKKLGQYFTPRELIQVMFTLVGKEKIINSIISGEEIKVLDPACGTGGFLVFLMKDALEQLGKKLKERKITNRVFQASAQRIRENVFYGSDANYGVAASAKMNMIIAGDGHTNIKYEDSLSKKSKNWSANNAQYDLILTNPPFGTSESDSLTSSDFGQFPIKSKKGQYLFLQKMIKATVAEGEICTVIDEGVLNTDSGKDLRKYILQQCKLIAVVNLPLETFKPNKINVKSSLLYLRKRTVPDLDFEDKYKVTICELTSLGYHGSGEKIRGFQFSKYLEEIENDMLDISRGSERKGYHWNAFDINIKNICEDNTYRFDSKYWNISIRRKISKLTKQKNPTLYNLNIIPTTRGKSPTSDSYVDEQDGHALVMKAGSNISKFGEVVRDNADWIEKSVYDEFLEKSKKSGNNINIIKSGDVLISSTGDGTLGKCCVFNMDIPAVADGHVTIIRVNKSKIDPFYLCDYLRYGFGAKQIARLYTGSTGLIELTPDHINSIVIDTLQDSLQKQRGLSRKIRKIEKDYKSKKNEAQELLLALDNVL